MTMLKRLDRYSELWRIALPHIEPPTIQDAGRWAEYPPAIVERAILRTARKFAQVKIASGFIPSEAYRYASSVARAMCYQNNA